MSSKVGASLATETGPTWSLEVVLVAMASVVDGNTASVVGVDVGSVGVSGVGVLHINGALLPQSMAGSADVTAGDGGGDGALQPESVAGSADVSACRAPVGDGAVVKRRRAETSCRTVSAVTVAV